MVSFRQMPRSDAMRSGLTKERKVHSARLSGYRGKLADELNNPEIDMITLGAFLVLLGAASLPATYILILSRWLEPEYRKAYPVTRTTESVPAAKPQLIRPVAQTA
jgi:hypothetical protein